jgi:hypothetical protein
MKMNVQWPSSSVGIRWSMLFAIPRSLCVDTADHNDLVAKRNEINRNAVMNVHCKNLGVSFIIAGCGAHCFA